MMTSNKLNIDHLSETECQRILGVLQRDFELRSRERSRLRAEEIIPNSTAKPPKPPRAHQQKQTPTNKQQQIAWQQPSSSQSVVDITSSNQLYSLQDSLNQFTSHSDGTASGGAGDSQLTELPSPASHNQLDDHRTGSSRHHAINANRTKTIQFCSRCGDSLSPLAKRRAQCVICNHWICKPCAMWEPKYKGYICEEHDEEQGYDEYNRNSTDWVYDSENRRFVKTCSGEIAATISHRLSEGGDYHSMPIIEDIPQLSLEAFEQSMKGLLNQPSVHKVNGASLVKEAVPADAETMEAKESIHRVDALGANRLNVSNFFQSTAEEGANLITAVTISDQLDEKLAGRHNDVSDYSQASFEVIKEDETKKFLVDINLSVQKIKDCLANNDSESQIDEMLTFHRSVISAMVTNLEQALHLAVDNQVTASVKHTDVASIVCSIIEEFAGESLPGSVFEGEGTLNYGEVADCILVKIVEDEESEHDDTGEGSSKSSFSDRKESTTPSTDASHSDYGSFKLPSFNSKHAAEIDPDLLSLGQSSNALMEDAEEGFLSEGSGPWDGDSIISDSSCNWFFRGKAAAYDSLSGQSSLFNTHSTSEESLNVMFVPQPSYHSEERRDDFSDDSSDLTLTSISGDSLLPETLNLTPRAEVDDEMIRTELRRTHSSQGDHYSNPGYVSLSRHTSSSTSHTGSRTSEHSETGEESDLLKFSTKPRSQTVARGDVAKFTCAVSGASPIDVYWFKEGVDDTDSLETNEKYEVTSHDDKHTLEVFFTSLDDHGQYLCLAKNDNTSSHWLFGLTVEEPSSYEQKPPLFLKELYDMEAQEGDTIKFRCKVRAYPPPRVCWFKDGQIIQASSVYKLEKFGNRDYVLTIIGITADQDAEFTVLAKNEAGEAKSTAQLLVEQPEGDKKSPTRPRDRPRQVSHALSRRQRNYASAYELNEKTAVQKYQGSPNAGLMQSSSLKFTSVKGGEGNAHYQPSSEVEKESNEQRHVGLGANEAVSNAANAVPTVNSEKTTPEREVASETTSPIKPRRSLRAAFRKETDDPRCSEEQNTVTLTPVPKPHHLAGKESDQKIQHNVVGHSSECEPMSEQKPAVNGRHSSVVELTKINPLKTVANLPIEPSEPTQLPHSVTHVKEQTDDRNTLITTPNLNKVEETGDTSSTKQLERAERAGVDIQPGFVRERQFQELGYKVTPIKPAAKHKKGIAPTIPASPVEAETLHGSAELEDLPSSRGEWSNFFPSVKQRRQSFDSDTSSLDSQKVKYPTADKPIIERNNNNNDDPQQSLNKKRAPAPQPPNRDKTERRKKKTVKKVVRRTVSVKKSSVDFGDGPPVDGCEYIKICGKWVKMKSKSFSRENSALPGRTANQKDKNEVQKINDESGDANGIPTSRAEWGEGLAIGTQMKAFKRSQEAKGSVITGRSLGPITKV